MDLRALVLTVAIAIASCSSKPVDQDVPPPADIETPKLGPGDQLRITTSGHPDLSGVFGLDETGNLVLPLIGNITASGKTVRQLEDAIEAGMSNQGWLVDPQVSVEVLALRNEVYIEGHAKNPGPFNWVEGMTVADALALAGADRLSEAAISREGVVYAAEMNTPILPGDVIILPERFF